MRRSSLAARRIHPWGEPMGVCTRKSATVIDRRILSDTPAKHSDRLWNLLDLAFARAIFSSIEIAHVSHNRSRIGSWSWHYYRHRCLSAELGRFVSRDPLGYVDSSGFYLAYFAPTGLDPYGQWVWPWDPRASWWPSDQPWWNVRIPVTDNYGAASSAVFGRVGQGPTQGEFVIATGATATAGLVLPAVIPAGVAETGTCGVCLAEGQSVIGWVMSGRVAIQSAPITTHAILGAEAGLVVEGQAVTDASAFTVIKSGGELFVLGARNFGGTLAVLETTRQAVISCFR